MTFEEFHRTISNTHPPEKLNLILKALWYDAKDQWEQSHAIVQDIHTIEGSRIHAYLHRKEGDLANARYWYSQAGETIPKISLIEEAELLINRYLKQ